MHSLRPDIDATDKISWRDKSTLRAAVRPLMFASLPTNGTGLRGIRFIDLNCAGQLIAKLRNHPRIGGRRNRLRLLASQVLRRIIERLSDIRLGVREFIGNLARRLMNLITHTISRFRQHFRLAFLQLPPAARALRFLRLQPADSPEFLVAIAEIRFQRAPADRDNLLPIGGGNQSIDAQIHADRWPQCFSRWIGAFEDQQNFVPAQADLHQSPWLFHLGQLDVQSSGFSVRQKKKSVTDSGSLIGVGKVSMVVLSPWIFGICKAVLAQSAGGFNRFEEFTDDLLHSLAMEIGVATFAPFLPSAFSGPLPVGATNAEMAIEEIIPEARRLFPGLLIDVPLPGTRW